MVKVNEDFYEMSCVTWIYPIQHCGRDSHILVVSAQPSFFQRAREDVTPMSLYLRAKATDKNSSHLQSHSIQSIKSVLTWHVTHIPKKKP
jgi:hypothetical protein